MTESGIESLGVLTEPLRRRLYDYVVEQGGEVSRAGAAEAVGARRNLAGFHLDKLVEAGLLEVAWRKVSGREGPGSGRPAKLYRRSRREHAVHLPPRDYGTAAALLAEAVDRAGAERELYASAFEEGVRRGTPRAVTDAQPSPNDLARWLESDGYEPAPIPPGARADSAGSPDAARTAEPGEQGPAPARSMAVLRLRNCPFDAVARTNPPVACGMNLELLRGLLRGAGADSYRADMAPGLEGCCVVISAIDSKTISD